MAAGQRLLGVVLFILGGCAASGTTMGARDRDAGRLPAATDGGLLDGGLPTHDACVEHCVDSSTMEPDAGVVVEDAGSVVPPTTASRRLSAGTDHVCVVAADAQVYCWGGNPYGQLGVDDAGSDRARPVPGLTGAVAVAASFGHTCVVDGSAHLHCFGRNDHGQLGDGTTENRRAPVAISTPPVRRVAVGAGHTCIVTMEGEVWCWGDNNERQLGTAAEGDQLRPGRAGSISDAIDIAVGDFHSCAVREGGEVWCWGSNGRGQLGQGSLGGIQPSPVVVDDLSGVRALSSGYRATSALLETGTLAGWGENQNGQLGVGTSSDAVVATAVGGLAGVVAFDQDAFHGCAVISDRTAKCWGYNVFGQLGDGSLEGSPTPVAVEGIAGVQEIAAGTGHFTCALTDDEDVWCWGRNDRGQLGDGTETNRRAPVVVLGLP